MDGIEKRRGGVGCGGRSPPNPYCKHNDLHNSRKLGCLHKTKGGRAGVSVGIMQSNEMI